MQTQHIYDNYYINVTACIESMREQFTHQTKAQKINEQHNNKEI